MMALPEIWQMWAVFGIVAIGVWFYVRESFTIEAISVGIILALMLFFHLFGTTADIGNAQLLSGFAAPALVTIMALLVVGQGMFQTGALEGPIVRINNSLDRSPRLTLLLVFTVAFTVSMFMNNTPVVVMFIPVMAAMAVRLRHNASRYMMPLSFVSILAGMTTLIGSSTNLLVNDVLVRTTEFELSFFTQFVPGMAIAAIGAAYIILMAPILLPERQGLETEINASGYQYIAQIRVTPNHPLVNAKPIAGPNLLSSQPEYLRGMLTIGGFEAETDAAQPLIISEAVIAPGSRMIGRTIEQVGFRRQTGTLVLGVQRRSRMIRKRMLEIRLEAGDVLLLFGYDSDMLGLRNNRDLLLLDWSMVELPDIRKSLFARIIFIATIAMAATSILPIEIAALGGALGMIATGCLNIRQAVRALDMRIFLLIGAAFAMGLSLEQTGGAAYIGEALVSAFMPYGNQILIGAVFIVIAFFTNIISNSAAALLFSPIALEISAQTGIDPIAMVLTVIFAANCCFATPIAYQTNLLILGPGHYKFSDFIRFGGPLILLLWISYTLLAPVFFQL